MPNGLLIRRLLVAVAVCVALTGADVAVADDDRHPGPSAPQGGTSAPAAEHEGQELAPRIGTQQFAVGTGKVTITDVRYVPGAPSAPESLTLPDDAQITVWKLNAAGTFYDDVTADTTLGKNVQDEWEIGGLSTGTYAFRFDATDPSIGAQYFDNQRYWGDSQDVSVTDGATTPLGTVDLTPRTIDTWRITGIDRYGTAVETSRSSVADGAHVDTVYLADGTNYPDALAAGPAAIYNGGLLLLTKPTALPASTKQRLQELTPTRVVVLGQTNSVSAAVVADVKKAVPAAQVVRFAGANRFATSEMIVRDAFDMGNIPVAFIVTGRNFPDALSAGAAAGYIGAPVILVEGAAPALSAATSQLLTDLGVETALIAGGTNMVSTGIENELTTRYGADHVHRYAGANRYETAAQINADIFYRPDFGVLTSGEKFPDALAGTVYAGSLGAPLHLTRAACLSVVAGDTIWEHRANGVILLGGPTTLSPAVEDFEPCP